MNFLQCVMAVSLTAGVIAVLSIFALATAKLAADKKALHEEQKQMELFEDYE